MTDTTMGTKKEGHKGLSWSDVRSRMSKVLGQAFWVFFTKRVLVARALPITICLFLTINMWGGSYWQWMERWGRFVWGRLPNLPLETQLQFGIFIGVGVAMFLAILYLFWKKHCDTFLQAVFWRVITSGVLILAFYNPWLSYYDYAVEWRKRLLADSLWELSPGEKFEVYALAFIGVAVLTLWHYFFKKAWQGVGSSKLTAVLVVAAIVTFVGMMSSLGIWPKSFAWRFTIVEIFLGLAIGICFSLTLLDRFFSGTVGATTTIKEIDADSGHHDIAQDQDHGHDAAVLEQDDAAASHR